MTKSLLDQLLDSLRRLPLAPRPFHFDAPLLEALRQVAEREQRSEDDVAADLLNAALRRHDVEAERIATWEELSPREQQVAALTCLGLTNRQIASRLHLSPETIKTHMRNAQRKFRVANKSDLRALLSDWDFRDWG